jgi:glutathione S-transferase
MQLFYSPGSCSLAAHLALEATGLGFEAVPVPLREGAHLKPEFRAVNPRARVPALVVDGRVLTETLAILLYLDERCPRAGLLPRQDAWLRARALEWMSHFTSGLHPLFRALWRPGWYCEDAGPHAALSQGADRRLVQLYAELDAALCDTPFFLGAEASAVDYYALVFARWGSVLSVPTARHPRLAAWHSRVAALPQVQRVAEREGIDPLRRPA